MQKPSKGRIVHYVSYGTPGGEYPSVCRAALVTDVEADSYTGEVSLCVVNPSGFFFNHGVQYDDEEKAGGTWHWPERED